MAGSLVRHITKGAAYDRRVAGHIRAGHRPVVAKTLAAMEVDPDEEDAEDKIEDLGDQGRDEATEATAQAGRPPVSSTKPMVPNPHKPDLRPAEIKGSSDGSWADAAPGKKQMGGRTGGSFKAVGKRKAY